MKEMSVDSRSGLSFQNYGPEDAPALVFLHAGGVSGWMWKNQVEYFKTKYHCLVPDLPEQGESQNVGPFSVEFAADRVAEFIRSQANGKATVIGLSEGAQVSVALLAQAPEVVERAFISSAILHPIPGALMYTEGLFRTSYRWFMAPFKNNDWWIRLNMRYSAGIGDEYFPEFKRSFQETSEGGFTHLMTCAMQFRMPAGLEKAGMPVLVVVGKLEYKQMIQSGLDLIHTLPNARGVMVSLGEGSSLAKEHNWALSAPQLFNDSLNAWLEDAPWPENLLSLSEK
jgi:pimeloyl-ACP methyl ester carboxylesterase